MLQSGRRRRREGARAAERQGPSPGGKSGSRCAGLLMREKPREPGAREAASGVLTARGEVRRRRGVPRRGIRGGGTKERRSPGKGRHLVASPFLQGGREAGPLLRAECPWAPGTGSRRGWVRKGVLPSEPTPASPPHLPSGPSLPPGPDAPRDRASNPRSIRAGTAGRSVPPRRQPRPWRRRVMERSRRPAQALGTFGE